MTGNAPDLRAFAEVARRHGALLYVDDAHGFGVIGERGPDEPSPVRHCAATASSATPARRYDGHRPRRRLLQGVLVAARVHRLPDRGQAAAQGRGAAVPLLRARRRSPRSPPCSPGFDVNERRGDALRADLHALTARLLDALDRLDVETPEPLGPADRRDPAAATTSDIDDGRPLPVRARRLRHARRLPARAQGRGRLPRPAHRGRTPTTRSTALIAALEELVERGELRSARRGRRARGGGGMTARRASGSAPRLGRLPRASARCCARCTSGVPPFKGSGPLMNLIGLSPVLAILVGIRWHRPGVEAAVAAARRGLGAVLARRPLHVQLPAPARRGGPVPVAGRRALRRDVPGDDGRPAAARPAAQRRPRPQRADRRPDPHRRPLAAVVDRADGAVPPPGRPVAARQDRLGRVPGRRRDPDRRRRPPGARRRPAGAGVLPADRAASCCCSSPTSPTGC